MIGIKRNSKRIEKQKFIAKYGTSLLNIDDKEEKTLNPSSVNYLHLNRSGGFY